MSRSYKKNGIIKDRGLTRGEYNRRFRRVNNQRIKDGKEPKLMYEITNQYDVCDYKLFWDRGFYYHQISKYYSENECEFEKRKRLYFNK